jgi:hypothetical protein
MRAKERFEFSRLDLVASLEDEVIYRAASLTNASIAASEALEQGCRCSAIALIGCKDHSTHL